MSLAHEERVGCQTWNVHSSAGRGWQGPRDEGQKRSDGSDRCQAPRTVLEQEHSGGDCVLTQPSTALGAHAQMPQLILTTAVQVLFPLFPHSTNERLPRACSWG